VSAAPAHRREGAEDVPLFEIVYTVGALATAALCILAVTRPATALLLFFGTAALLLCIWRVEVALLVLVAVGPLEAAYRPSSGITLTKIAGVVAFASFAFSQSRSSRPRTLTTSRRRSPPSFVTGAS